MIERPHTKVGRALAMACFAAAAAACGSRGTPYKATGPLAQGLTACGGSLSLVGDWQKETAGELVGKGAVKSIERLEHGVRIVLEDDRSFVIGLAPELAPPVAVGDTVDVSIVCQTVGWNSLACSGTVHANGELVAFDGIHPAIAAWTIVRGPLVERRTHKNYGPTSHYGLQFTFDGATATSPRDGCATLQTSRATFRVSGGEVSHAGPRAPDSADTFYFRGVRAR